MAEVSSHSLLELLSTEGCHLCDLAIDVLSACPEVQDFEVDWVEIAYDDTLMQTYAERIPVLRHPASGQELGWPFDCDQLQKFLRSIAAG
ncbi:glutaredoxin family protein [Nitrincola tapanii]|uniref:glutaredoxin family protein n=1 Tax=Nitrincola tapanii TaxID=1708751 RepID=UPI00190F6269|nr:glutaredoxin family protein [Nitrincola tapanii]